MEKTKKPYENFDIAKYKWSNSIDYRKHPEKYLVGKGEQGVLMCNPYKTEIVKYWRFATPKEALISSDTIYQMFLEYLEKKDFVGADMARKFLQMGITRSRRYANYKSGKKYREDGTKFEKGSGDPLKAESALIFSKKWRAAEDNPTYAKMKREWKEKSG